jgi:hypothetical protein
MIHAVNTVHTVCMFHGQNRTIKRGAGDWHSHHYDSDMICSVVMYIAVTHLMITNSTVLWFPRHLALTPRPWTHLRVPFPCQPNNFTISVVRCWNFTVSWACCWVAHVYGTAGGERDLCIGRNENERRRIWREVERR